MGKLLRITMISPSPFDTDFKEGCEIFFVTTIINDTVIPWRWIKKVKRDMKYNKIISIKPC